MTNKILMLPMILLLLSSAFTVSSKSTEESDWREEYAYAMGISAMHYVYPYWRMAHVRYDWTQKTLPEKYAAVVPNQQLHKFWNASKLTNSDWQEGGGPNNDTLYSGVWLKLDEPVILTIPDMDRFYSFEMVGMNSDNFAYVSELKHGRKGGDYAILPMDWQGELPKGVTALPHAPSQWVFVAGRTYVAGEHDLPAVTALMQQYKVTPLSQWGQKNPTLKQPEVFKPFDKTFKTIDDPMAVWRTINYTLTENPPIGDEAKLIRLFQEINIGPGLNVDDLDDASKRGLARAAVEGFRQIKAAKRDGAGHAFLEQNGWFYTLSAAGRGGEKSEFMLRSVHQSYGGLIANDVDEAIYFLGFRDANGDLMDGNKNYEISMPAGSEPDVGAFWSITLYDLKANLVANEINRYSIGDRTEGLVRDAAGGLKFSIQNKRPTDKTTNWLPTPKGPFWLMLRTYQPSETIQKGEWKLPKVTVVK